MRWRVSRRTLLLIAGLVWIIAGANILRIGIITFFDVKGWLIMGFMITLGILVRKLHLLPTSFIAVFYTGLSSALILTGILFLVLWQKTK